MKKIMNICLVAAALGAPLVMTGCANSSPDLIKRGEAQRMAQVEDAVVLSVRAVTIDGTQSGIGGVVGGVVGAVGGYAGSGVQREAQVLGVLAGVGGALVGNAIERAGSSESAYEILVQLKDGERRAIVQAKGSEVFQPGDPVLIVTSGGKVRVSKAPK